MHSTTVNQNNYSCRVLRTIQTTHPIPLRRYTGLPMCNWIGLRPFSTLRTPLLHLHWQMQQTCRRGNGGNTTGEHGWRGNFKIQTSITTTLPSSYCLSLNMGWLGHCRQPWGSRFARARPRFRSQSVVIPTCKVPGLPVICPF